MVRRCEPSHTEVRDRAALSALVVFLGVCGGATAQAEGASKAHEGGVLSSGGWFPFLVIFCSLGAAVAVSKTLEKKGALIRHGGAGGSGEYDVISAEGAT